MAIIRRRGGSLKQKTKNQLEDELPVSKNHPLYKWKKAELLVEKGRVSIALPDSERTQVEVEGFNGTYVIGVDISPGRMKCNCGTEHYSKSNEYVECAHTIAAHKFLSEIPEEKAKQMYSR